MVAANHMDNNDVYIKESMYMTNIMPQTAILNQQAYLEAEEIFECFRDIVNLNTIVGIIMGNNATNDYFVASHGVRSPDWYWRIIEKEIDGDVIAWIFVSFFSTPKSRKLAFFNRLFWPEAER
jgi:endonuclease G